MSGDGTLSVRGAIFGRSRFHEQRRRNRVTDLQLEKEDQSINHAWRFKSSVTHEPEVSETRPLPRCCKSCLPEVALLMFEDVKHAGLTNCLTFPLSLRRDLPSAHNYDLPLVSCEEIEKDPKLLSLFTPETLENSEFRDTARQRVLEAVSQLKVHTVPKWMFQIFSRVAYWLTQKYLSCIFDEVLVHQGQIEILKDLQSRGLPIVYIPTWRSSLDKVLIMWILAVNGVQPPLHISGKKENSFLSKWFGGIGTSVKVVSKTESDPELYYSSAIASYLRNVLRKRFGVLLNLEIGRTRTGRPSAQVYGSEFLRVIYDEFKAGHIEDAYFVPTSISYESLPESKEIFDAPKVHGGGLADMIFEILRRWFVPKQPKGKVRIDFSQPVCLRELEKSLQQNEKMEFVVGGGSESYARTRDSSLLRWSSNESVLSASPLYGVVAPLYPAREDEFRDATTLDVMSHHFLYDAGKSESVMTTHLIAFLLMKKYKGGVLLEQLKTETEWLIGVVRERKRDFGFYILDVDLESIIARAMEQLHEDIDVNWVPEKEDFRIAPKCKPNNLRRLEYYANYIFGEFMMDAIIAVVIFTLVGTQVTVFRGFDLELRVDQANLMTHAKRVYEIFTGGFLLHAPCIRTETAIVQAIEGLKDRGFLTITMRSSKHYAWEEDDYSDNDYCPPPEVADRNQMDEYFGLGHELKVVTSEVAYKYFDFHRSLLLPYLKIYAFLVRSLKRVMLEECSGENFRCDGKALERRLLSELESHADTEFSTAGELLNIDLVREFIYNCEDHGILSACEEDDVSLYFLSEKYQQEGGRQLEIQANDILFYVTV